MKPEETIVIVGRCPRSVERRALRPGVAGSAAA